MARVVTRAPRAVAGAALLVAAACVAIGPRPVATIADMPSRRTKLDGAVVHYRTNAERGADAVVLIHGWGCNLEFWREQVAALSPGRRVVLVDLPGHGSSDAPEVDYTLDRFARGVLAVMDDAGVRSAVLVGHSMGAAVSLAVLRRAGSRVRGIVSVDGSLVRPPMAAEQVQAFVARFEAPTYRDDLRAFVESSRAPRSTDEELDWIAEQALRTPQHVLTSAMRGSFDARSWSSEPIAVPVAVITTEAPHWSEEYRAAVNELAPRTSWRTLESVGHFLMLEDPAAFNAALLEALEAMDA